MCDMCAENVLRLSWIDWLSPISARTCSKTGSSASVARDRKAGLRHQREQSDGLERHRLAARVRTADQQGPAIVVQFERDRHHRLALPPQHVLEQRMPGVRAAASRRAEARDGAVELDGEARFGEEQFELAHESSMVRIASE